MNNLIYLKDLSIYIVTVNIIEIYSNKLEKNYSKLE